MGKLDQSKIDQFEKNAVKLQDLENENSELELTVKNEKENTKNLKVERAGLLDKIKLLKEQVETLQSKPRASVL